MAETKKRIFSGIQPSGVITIGNYLGAIKNWSHLSDEYDCVFCIVDLHALTVRQDPADLRKQTKSLLALYIACGLDPEKNILFVQSHVSAHSELTWVLNTYSYMGELNRMTQYKEKSQKYTNINVGLFDYPVLMVSDILLYQTDLVPIGHDQIQHVELTRDVALRFNNIYGNVFRVPEVHVGKVGARIMSLQEPTSKMSKSDVNANAYISLLDPPDVIKAKFKKAVTDSDRAIRFDIENKPGVSNLISIYSAATGKSFETIEAEFSNLGYGELKKGVGETIANMLTPIQQRYKEILKDRAYLDNVMKTGAERAEYQARKTLRKVYKKVGLIPRVR